MTAKIEKFCTLVIKVGTYLILCLPLLVINGFLTPNMQGKVFSFRILVEIMLIAWAWLALFGKDLETKPSFGFLKNYISYFCFGFFISAIFSSILGVDPSFSFWSDAQRMTGVLTLSHLVGFFIILVTFFKNKADWEKLLKFSVGISLLVCISALVENNFLNLINVTRLSGTIGNPSFLATYLLFNIFFSIFLVFSEQDRNQNLNQQLIFSLSGFLLFFTVIFSGTRGVILGLFAGFLTLLVLTFFYLWRTGPLKRTFQKNPKIGLLVIVVIFAGSLLTTLVYYNKNSALVARTPLKYISRINLNEGKRRILVWQLSWQGFKERPIFGWGPENFEVAYLKYYDPRLYEGEGASENKYDRAHNILVDTGVTQGIIGLSFYMALLVSTVVYLIRYGNEWLRDKSSPSLAQFLRAPPVLGSILIGLTVAYFAQNLFLFDTITSYILFFFSLAFVIRLSFSKESSPSHKYAFPRRILLELSSLKNNEKRCKILFLTLSLFMIYALWAYNLKPIYAARLMFVTNRYAANQDYKKSFIAARKYAELQPRADLETDSFLAKITWMLLKEKKDSEVAWQFFNLTESKLNSYPKTRLYAYIYLGKTYAIASDSRPEFFDKAIMSFKKALTLSPKQLFVYYDLAQIYANKKMYDKAYETLERVSSFDPSENPETVWHKYEIALKSGDAKKSLEYLRLLEEKNMRYKTSGKTSLAIDMELLTRASRIAISNDRKDLFNQIFKENYEKNLEEEMLTTSDTNLLTELFLFYFRIGEKEGAKSIINRIISIDPRLKEDLENSIKIIDSAGI